jgi:hypothetical protein
MTLHAKVLSLIEGKQTLKKKLTLIKWLQKKKLLQAICHQQWFGVL